MSQPALKRHPFDAAVELELAAWPGVTSSREVRSKHFALILNYQGKSRMVVYASTPGDTLHGAQNHVKAIRKELRELGAVRTKQARAEGTPKRHQPRAPIAPLRLVSPPARGNGPSRDPWAALASIQWPEPTPQTAPAPGFWRRLLAWLRRRSIPKRRI